MSSNSRFVPAALGLALVMFAAAPFVINTAPYESTMGLVQRIFYFHFPAAMSLFAAAFTCGIASLIYLRTRSPRSDSIAVAGAELAVVFGVIVLTTGPLWARKTWGGWWDWDAKLTSTLVMWLVFSSYLLLRRFGGPGSEVLSAAVGFFGMMLVPFVYMSVNFWRTLHPKTSVVANLAAARLIPAPWCLLASPCLFTPLRLAGARRDHADRA